MFKFINTLLLLTTLAGVSGCSGLGVQPWERDVLAQKKMQLDPYPVDTYLDEHIYSSREASSGGRGIGGGGCGCN
ncbi:MAG: DUF4266 domain-containing protein [Gammaproteobacteria bacterium]|jgi:hypothetical protein